MASDERFTPPPMTWRERLASFVEFRPRELIALAVVAAAIVAGATFAFVRALPHAVAGGPLPVGSGAPVIDQSSVPSMASGTIVVHVAGAVRKPGVYSFKAGARVDDAIAAAGGPAAGADEDAINRARPLSDGERIYVPRKGEQSSASTDSGAGPGAGADGQGQKVNVNTASESALEGLPGIGPALAQRIVDYRTQHGPFRTARDLMKVPGIGEKKFDALKDYVTV